jgi:hypothetical protein
VGLHTAQHRASSLFRHRQPHGREDSPSQLVHYHFDGKIISAFVWVPFNRSATDDPAIICRMADPPAKPRIFNRTVVALATRGYI